LPTRNLVIRKTLPSPLLLSATLHDPVQPALEKSAFALLPPEQAASIAGNRREQDRRLRTLVRLLLAEGLLLLEGRPFQDSLGRLAQTAAGRPFVRDCDWECSFSHSHELALCLIGHRDWRGRLGIDAEHLHPLPLEEVAVAFCAEEQNDIAKATDPQGRLFQLWTRKEAALKALGSGFLQEPATINLLSPRPVPLMPDLWSANLALQGLSAYAVAIATEKGPISSIRWMSPYAAGQDTQLYQVAEVLP